MINRINNIRKLVVGFLNTNKGAAIGLSITVIIYMFFAISRITNATIWYDEGYSVLLSKLNFGDIFYATAQDVHPPLYYWALKIWVTIFGVNEVSVRSLSIMFGCIALLLIYFLTKEFFSKSTSILVSILLAVSPLLVRYGIEARMYTMVVCICLLATILLIRIIKYNSRNYYIWYGVLVAAGVWTHYFTIVVWLSHWIYRAYYLNKKYRNIKTFLRAFFSKKWMLAHILSVALFLPWISRAISQFISVNTDGFWILPLSFMGISNLFSVAFLYRPSEWVIGVPVLLSMLLIVMQTYMLIRVWKSKLNHGQRNGLSLFICLAFVPIFSLAILSIPPFRSFFHERYLLTSIVFIYILFAIIPIIYIRQNVRPLWIPILSLVLVLTLFVYGNRNISRLGDINFDEKSMHKQNNARALIDEIHNHSINDTPIIVCSPSLFLESNIYSTSGYPILNPKELLYNEVNREIGVYDSVRRLKNNQITNINHFLQENGLVWFASFSNSDTIEKCVDTDIYMRPVLSVYATDRLVGGHKYAATLYSVKE